MTRLCSLSLTLPVALTVLAAFSVGCQSPPATPAKAEPAKAEPAKAEPVRAAHGAAPHGAAPHGAAPAKSREPVNPREVTPSGTMRDEAVPGLKYKVPEEWAKKPGSSSMRLAEYTLPGPGGDAELAVYRFAGGGGDAKSNIHRWRTQFSKADGSPLGEGEGQVQVIDRAPLKITLVDLSGTYVAQVTPGAAERYSDPNYRMVALIVEGSGDPFFFKAVGPEPTLELWRARFMQLAESFAAG